MTKDTKSYSSATISKLPQSLIEIIGSIPTDVWEKFRTVALARINQTVTIPGFRNGQVPENVLVAKVGEATINEEMAELALNDAYNEIVQDNSLDVIGKPQVTVTKLAAGNPLEFKIESAVVPEVSLPDYRSLSAKLVKAAPIIPNEIADSEVDEAILKLRRARASQSTGLSNGLDQNSLSAEEREKRILDSLPEFNEDFVRSLSAEFSNVEDFKKKIRVMIGENKKGEAREKLRLKIADSLVENTTLELPEVMIESEINRTQAQFEADIEQMNVKLADYLKRANKTVEDIRAEWRPHAKKKAKLQLMLNGIARQEKIIPSAPEIEAEVNHIVEHYKDADRDRAAVYAETILTNEKVFQFLEKI